MLFWSLLTQVYMHPRSKNTYIFLYYTASALFSECLKWFDKGFSLSKPLLSNSLLCSDWSDGPVCCDWLTKHSLAYLNLSFSSALDTQWYEHKWWRRKCIKVDLLLQRRKQQLLDTNNMNQSLSYNYSVRGRGKVDVVHRQPMKTIGWHYANLLQTYVGK